MPDEDTGSGEYASPPCYAHELDPLQRDFAVIDSVTCKDVMRWRKAERERLYALRDALPLAQRTRQASQLCAALNELLASAAFQCVGAYWPIRMEPDLRPWMRQLDAAGVPLALPVIRGHDGRMEYSRWRFGETMQRGRWGIAEPAVDALVEPDLVIAPLVGVDREGFRLGNGGGYFDRYLAERSPRPLAVGVGFATARIDTIYPQAHDIPMARSVIGTDR